MRKLGLGLVMLAAVGLVLAGCSDRKTSWRKKSLDPFAGIGSPHFKGGKIPKGTGKRHVGKPYQVAGRWFTPKVQPNYDKTGIASWYGDAFHRRMTSNGEWFDMHDMTAAHPTLPLPSYAKVTNLETGRAIIVRINDRGPFVGTRLIDLSKRSADALGFRHQGKAEVRVQYLGPAPLRDKGEHLIAMNRKLGQGASVNQLRQIAQGNDDEAPQLAETQQQPAVQLARAEEPTTKRQLDAYVIAVGMFADPENAAAASNQLAAFNAAMVPVQTSDGLMYRVQIGPIVGRNEVRDALYAVRDAGFVEARVVSTRVQEVAAKH